MYAPGLFTSIENPATPLPFSKSRLFTGGKKLFDSPMLVQNFKQFPPGRGGVGARTCNVRFQRDRKSKLLNTGALKHGIRNPESGIWNPETKSRKWKQKPKQNSEYVKEGSKRSV